MLNKELISQMKKTIDDSDITDIEIGFALCETNDKKIISGKTVYGTQIEIEPKKLKCQVNTLKVGTFHTHPKESPELSSNDTYHFYDTNINCIGSKVDNKYNINCFTKKRRHNTKDKKITENLMNVQEKVLRNLFEKNEIGEVLGNKYLNLVKNAENLYIKDIIL